MSRLRRNALGLRGRLALFFVAIVVIPLLIALVALGGQLRQQRQLQDVRTVEQSAASISRTLNETSEALNVVVDSLSTEATGGALAQGETSGLDDQLEQVFGSATGVVDFIAAVNRDGQVVAEAGEEPDIAAGQRFADFSEIGQAASNQEGVAGAIVAGRVLTTDTGERLGFVAAGNWIDADELRQLPKPLLGGAATLAGDQIWASSETPAALVPSTLNGGRGGFRAQSATGQPLIVRQVEGVNVGGARIVVWGPDSSAFDITRIVTRIVLPTAAFAAIAGWLLAGTVIAPVGRAASAARAIAAGYLDRKVAVGGGGRELDDLSHALNTMSDQLSQRVAELERSRDELRGSLSRLGETLSSSLDLDRTLAVVTETAMDTLTADRAVLMLFTPERDALYAKVGRGVGDAVPRVRPGQGRLGWVAVEGIATLIGDTFVGAQTTALRATASDMPPAVDGEPTADRQLLVPLVGRGETLGVLSLFRDDANAGDFRSEDLETLQSFAAQAAVAVENVLLHEEAQRRSLTDALTGLWNFRHFEAQAARELESAARFQRPLSLLVVDLDHFKDINDRLGHQAGDEVLRELARRIRDSARAPDLVARYGGEEFVVLLPGADPAGAQISAERMRRRLGAAPCDVGGDVPPVEVTCSIGVASYPDHAEDVFSLLRRADESLYAAKAGGRNQVVVWSGRLSDQSSA